MKPSTGLPPRSACGAIAQAPTLRTSPHRCAAGARVLQQDAERAASRRRLVGLRRVLDGEAVRDQRRHVEPAARPSCRAPPRSCAARSSARSRPGSRCPCCLVVRVVAARAVGARDLEAQLLLVEVGARQLEPGDAHQHDAAALAAHLRRLVHRLVALGGGGDQHARRRRARARRPCAAAPGPRPPQVARSPRRTGAPARAWLRRSRSPARGSRARAAAAP